MDIIREWNKGDEFEIIEDNGEGYGRIGEIFIAWKGSDYKTDQYMFS